ncbi:MAG: flavodoxin [Asgard group archaeon]|nr:flavodoxin [Asgard group archaeon]
MVFFMKSLVIYYSKTGNTKLMAEKIAEELNSDLLALKEQKKIKSSGFGLYFRGGFYSMTKKKMKLEEIETNFEDYDLIFLGTPVWAWRLNPVVRSFLKTTNFTGKKFGLFSCCAGSAEKILQEMKEILHENDVLGEIEFIEPLKKETEKNIERAKTWAQDISKKAK